MRAEISFLASGYIKQTVNITKEGYTAEQLQKDLNSGKVVTTVQEDGTVDVTETGEVIGTVESVDNNLEYEDFDVEEE